MVPKPDVVSGRKQPALAGNLHLPRIFAICAVGMTLAKGWAETRKGLTVKHVILSFIRNESGAAAAEYALILAIVGAGIAVAAGQLGTAISTAINSAKGQI